MGFSNNNDLLEKNLGNDIYQKYITQFDIIFLLEKWKSQTSISRLQYSPEAYLEPSGTSTMECFCKNG